ncbi:hypothetical protein HMPREF0063_12519 [Aeromicrobium marinum DSM 15272]|uniref:Uncharacterized protein n=1 Tax=Aeromicrobium marinum DSM 15272 TaxID=585531 RepID=E2SER0_9ACTN|nr:hypothetical protein HMPREF0063_12519 [Aeromicrobium marinum DSM 15272]
MGSPRASPSRSLRSLATKGVFASDELCEERERSEANRRES